MSEIITEVGRESNGPPRPRLKGLADPKAEFYLTNRSAAETDDKCGMAFWWNQHEGKRGIVPIEQSIHLLVGAQIHDDFAALGAMKDISHAALQTAIDDILSPLTDEDKKDTRKMEIMYRRLGWIAAWGIYMEPVIREHWENVMIEGELILDRDPLFVAVTPDRLLRNKKHGFLKYLEFKTTRFANQKWLNSWPFQIQMHTSLAAVKEEFPNEDVRYAVVCGLMKGNESQSDGRLIHPYVWGYQNTETGEWTHDYQRARSSQWISMPVWEYPDGVVKWVLKVGEETARMQFPQTAPIFYNDRMLANWVERRLARERQVKIVKELCRKNLQTRQVYFEQRTRNCRPAFGDPCPYLQACWNAETGSNPQASGLYAERTPHHEVEIIGLEI